MSANEASAPTEFLISEAAGLDHHEQTTHLVVPTTDGAPNESLQRSQSSCFEPKHVFHVIRKCKLLHAPVIFCSTEDCDLFLGEQKQSSDIEYGIFQHLTDVAQYIFPNENLLPITIDEKQLVHSAVSKEDESVKQNTIVTSKPVDDPSKQKKRRPFSDAIPERKKRKTFSSGTSTLSGINDQRKVRQHQKDGRQWDERFKELTLFHQEHGHCDVKEEDDPRLHEWVLEMREDYKDRNCGMVSVLNLKRIAAMRQLDFDFIGPEIPIPKRTRHRWIEEWDEMLKLLSEYKNKYGTADVPKKDPIGFEGLGLWVFTVRKYLRMYRENPSSAKNMTEEKVQQLVDVGFCINPSTGRKRYGDNMARPVNGLRNEDKNWQVNWDKMVDMYARFKNEHGSIDLRDCQTDIEGYPGLRLWLLTACYYIRQYNADPGRCTFLDDHKVNSLLNLGLVLYKKDKDRKRTTDFDWDTMFGQLVQFKEQHDHIRVPKSNVNLNTWLNRMKNEYDKMQDGEVSMLTPERVVKMASLGFNFSRLKRLSFEERTAQWSEYKRTHDGKDPPRHDTNGLGDWVSLVRIKYAQKKNGMNVNLTQEQIDRLTELGFQWEVPMKSIAKYRPKQSWNDSFAELVQYKEKFGHVMVPRHDPRLGIWVHSQRRGYSKFLSGQKSHLTTQKIRKLTELGFAFRTTSALTRRYNTNNNTNNNNDASHTNSIIEDENEHVLAGVATIEDSQFISVSEQQLLHDGTGTNEGASLLLQPSLLPQHQQHGHHEHHHQQQQQPLPIIQTHPGSSQSTADFGDSTQLPTGSTTTTSVLPWDSGFLVDIHPL